MCLFLYLQQHKKMLKIILFINYVPEIIPLSYEEAKIHIINVLNFILLRLKVLKIILFYSITPYFTSD